MVTMEEISKRAGVTKATVSNILNGRLKATRSDAARRADHVRKIAVEMGYRINRAASATKTGRTGCIGMLMSQDNRYSVRVEDFERGLAEALEERNLLLLSGLIDPKRIGSTSYLPRIVGESLADGLIINYAYHIPPAVGKMINEHGRAAVWINSKHVWDCVYPDDFGAAYEGVRYLLERGHRKIAYGASSAPIDPKACHYSVIDRRAGYVAAMADAGLVPRILEPQAPPVPTHQIDEARAMVLRLGDATALIHNAPLSPFLLAAAQSGVRIPKDLSLISFENDSVDSRYFACASLVVPFFEMAKRAVALLSGKLENANARFKPVPLKYQVRDGPTVGTLSGPR